MKILCLVKQARHKRANIMLFHLYEISRKDKIEGIKNRTVVARGWGKEGMYTYKFTFFVWVLCDNEDSIGRLVQVRKNLGSGSCFLLH